MDYLRKKAIGRAFMGFGLGAVICVMITTFFATYYAADGNLYVCSQSFTERIGDPFRAFVLEILISGIYGAVIMGSTIVYEIESWSLVRVTVTHFVIWVFCFFTVGFFLGWISPKDVTGCVVSFAFWAAIYFLIWLINYISYKNEIKEINAELLKLKNKNQRNVA